MVNTVGPTVSDERDRGEEDVAEAEQRVYYPASADASVSETILEAVEEYEGVGTSRSEFVLYDAPARTPWIGSSGRRRMTSSKH